MIKRWTKRARISHLRSKSKMKKRMPKIKKKYRKRNLWLMRMKVKTAWLTMNRTLLMITMKRLEKITEIMSMTMMKELVMDPIEKINNNDYLINLLLILKIFISGVKIYYKDLTNMQKQAM